MQVIKTQYLYIFQGGRGVLSIEDIYYLPSLINYLPLGFFIWLTEIWSKFEPK